MFLRGKRSCNLMKSKFIFLCCLVGCTSTNKIVDQPPPGAIILAPTPAPAPPPPIVTPTPPTLQPPVYPPAVRPTNIVPIPQNNT